jgi:hypothetical protein
MPDETDVLILQSHRRPLPGSWLSQCLASVQGWAAARGYQYRFEDDALFTRLPDDLREKTAGQPVIAADLARLAALDEALVAGCGAAVWIDADTLVIDPDNFTLPDEQYALGREVWVQNEHHRLRAYVKVHNAFLLFRRGNPFLDFYRHAAERLVRAHAAGPMSPQFVGPKLLTALHNLVGCPVAERAAMLSPAVARDLLRGGGDALTLFRTRSHQSPAALNLCGSLVGRELAEHDLRAVIALLREEPGLVAAEPASSVAHRL